MIQRAGGGCEQHGLHTLDDHCFDALGAPRAVSVFHVISRQHQVSKFSTKEVIITL